MDTNLDITSTWHPPASGQTSSASPDAIASHEGRVYDHRWRVGPLIGKGSYGVVHRGKNLKTNSDVAIKISLGSDHTYLSQEAINLVLLETLLVPDVPHFEARVEDALVMELIEGENLVTYPNTTQSAPPNSEEINSIIKYLGPVAHTLTKSAEAGFFHCDVKPENIIVRTRVENGKVVEEGVLVDWALGRTLKDCEKFCRAGTPQYMAPEALIFGELNPTTDVYAFGATLYHLICHQPPRDAGHKHSTAQAQIMHLINSEVTPPHEINPYVSEEVSAVVMATLRDKPEDRITMTDLLDAFTHMD